jgi:biopolymer transport protein ExbD
MAQLELQPVSTRKKRRKPHPSLRIDMTPMVDLGFLLITFFIFTTTMAEHKAEQIVVPEDHAEVRNTSPESATVSLLLGKDNAVFYYNGIWESALAANAVTKTNYNVYTGIGQLLRAKQKWLDGHYEKKRDGLILLIKPTDSATYQNFIDAIDEVTINHIKTYIVMQPSGSERDYALRH